MMSMLPGDDGNNRIREGLPVTLMRSLMVISYGFSVKSGGRLIPSSTNYDAGLELFVLGLLPTALLV